MATKKTPVGIEERLTKLEATLAQMRIRPNVDPSPDDPGWLGSWRWLPHLPVPIPRPQPGDPAPVDISRLSKAQLQLYLETIKASRIQLDALESMVQQHLK